MKPQSRRRPFREQLQRAEDAAAVDLVGVDQVAVPGQPGAHLLPVDLVDLLALAAVVDQVDQLWAGGRGDAAEHLVIYLEVAEHPAQADVGFLAAIDAALKN